MSLNINAQSNVHHYINFVVCNVSYFWYNSDYFIIIIIIIFFLLLGRLCHFRLCVAMEIWFSSNFCLIIRKSFWKWYSNNIFRKNCTILQTLIARTIFIIISLKNSLFKIWFFFSFFHSLYFSNTKMLHVRHVLN